MAGGMKNLAKDTAIYGGSRIVSKFFNWCLVPIYARVLTEGEYGLQSNLYSYVALFIVILTYGMETGFFRFVNKSEKDPAVVYSTTLISILFTTILFVILCFSFLKPIAQFLECGHHPEYVRLLVIIIAIDVFSAIPYAYLRYKKKPIRFAATQCGTILVIILTTIFLLVVCPWLDQHHPTLIGWFYSKESIPSYVFVANLIGVTVGLFALMPYLRGFKYTLDRELLKQMLTYCFPLLILGIAGILNQVVDRLVYPYLFADKEEAFRQLGIYSGCFKLTMVMMMFTQAFRFAYEPFIFAKNKDSDTKPYTESMKYFILFSLLIFLGVMFYMDILKHFLPAKYFVGLGVVPVILMGYIFFGIYFNLSFWYKMVDKTYFGAIFSIIGCVLTVAINIIYVPLYGYIASAWASFVCNLLMMLLSYFFERRYRPISYDYKTIGLYFGLTIVLYGVSCFVTIDNVSLRLLFNTILLLIFLVVVIKRDLPLFAIPSFKKLIRKK